MTPQQWFETMRHIWVNQTPENITHLLAADVEYHEDPLQPALTSVESIVEAWQEIKQQNIECVQIEMLHEHQNVGIAIWRFKEVNQPEHVGCYYLELNSNGKCKHFRQWWNIRR